MEKQTKKKKKKNIEIKSDKDKIEGGTSNEAIILSDLKSLKKMKNKNKKK